MIKVIIFDFDGVIINEYSKHYKLSKKQIVNLTENEFKKLFEGNVHSERKKLKYRNTGFDLKSHFSEHKKSVIIDQNIKNSLKILSKKYTLGIISSALESGTLECIKNNKLEDIFSFVYGYETHELKTKKFDLVFKNYKVSKDDCVFITDTLGDILEAKKKEEYRVLLLIMDIILKKHY